AVTGAVHFVTPVKLPSGKPLAAGAKAMSLAFAPDGSVLYVGVTVAQPALGGVRVLVVGTADGAVRSAFNPDFTTTIPMPPPPGSLPPSNSPSVIPHLNASGLAVSLGAGGNVVVSPDGQWLFDMLLLTQGQTPLYGVVRRISSTTGQAVQELAVAG